MVLLYFFTHDDTLPRFGFSYSLGDDRDVQDYDKDRADPFSLALKDCNDADEDWESVIRCPMCKNPTAYGYTVASCNAIGYECCNQACRDAAFHTQSTNSTVGQDYHNECKTALWFACSDCVHDAFKHCIDDIPLMRMEQTAFHKSNHPDDDDEPVTDDMFDTCPPFNADGTPVYCTDYWTAFCEGDFTSNWSCSRCGVARDITNQ